MNPLVLYFNLDKPEPSTYSDLEQTLVAGKRSKAMPLWEQLFMYAGIFLGVIFSLLLARLKAGDVPISRINLASICFAGLVALVLMPVVYDKLRIKPETPLIIRFALFVQHGVFWQVVFDGMGKILT